MTDAQTRRQARRLMREGLSDEAIEAQTGLRLMDILDLRAGASVEESDPPSRPRADGRHAVTPRPES